MCYSSQSSLTGALIGFIIFITLMIRNQDYDRTFGIIFGSSSLMQLTEFNIWKKIEKNKDVQINNLPIYFTLLFHYVSSCIAVQITDIVPKKIKNLYLILVILIFIILMFTLSNTNNFTKNITIGPNGHLNWGVDILSFAGVIFILIICGIISLLSYYTKSHYISTIGIILVLLLSVKNYYDSGEAGSMWCYWFNIIGLLLLLKL